MTPEEETALRSQVAQLREAVIAIEGSAATFIATPHRRLLEDALAATSDSEKWLAEHDIRVRADARRAALDEMAKHFESHEFLNVDGADVAEELRALKERQ